MTNGTFDSNYTNAFANVGQTAANAYTQARINKNAENIDGMLSRGDREGARRHAVAQGLYTQYKPVLDQMDAEQKAKLKTANDALVSTAIAVRNMPADQRAAFIQQKGLPYLAQHGYDASQLQGFDPSDDNALDAVIRQHMGYADALKLVEFDKEGTTDLLNQTRTNFGNPGKSSVVADGNGGFINTTTPGTSTTTYDRMGNVVAGGGHLTDMSVPHTTYVAQGSQEPAPASAPTGSSAPSGFEAIYAGFVKPTEGGYVRTDGRSGAPANYGINQRANPDIDVANLTPERAQQIMYDRYWKPSNADSLSGPIQAIHFDSAVNMGVGRANSLLRQSGGDAARYMELREAFHKRLGGNEQRGWANRNASLRRFSGLEGGQGTAPAAQMAPQGPTTMRLPDGTVVTHTQGTRREDEATRRAAERAEDRGFQMGRDDAAEQRQIAREDRAEARKREEKADAGLTLTASEVATARTKLAMVGRLGDQLDQMEVLDKEIYGGLLGGNVNSTILEYLPGQGGESSAQYDSLVSSISNMVTSITRIPGVGSQSDYEARLAAAMMPARDQTATGRAQAIQNLRALVRDMKAELSVQVTGRLPGGSGAAPAQQDNSAPVRITSRAQYDALPSGSRVIDPRSGQVRIKP